jgi:CRISPR-associated endoribonuclease Cas6
MPSRWEVKLAGPTAGAIPLTAPFAFISSWLDDHAQPNSAGPAGTTARQSGHNDQARKWAFGPLYIEPASAAQAAVTLQVRLLDDDLADRLQAAAIPGRHVRLGEHHFQVTQPAVLTEQTPWPALRHWSGSRAWQVRFHTPACFRRGNRTSPWPAPETIARSLTDRWQRLHPQTAPAPPGPGTGPIWVSDLEGRSEVHNLTRNVRRAGARHREDEVVSGFTGRIRYVCDRGTNDEAATFDALLAFAAFAGIGSHTTYGFGVIAAEPSWQPPTTRPPRQPSAKPEEPSLPTGLSDDTIGQQG